MGMTVTQDSVRAPAGSAAPLFTIITAVRNGAKTLDKTIASIAGQTFDDFEYLVIDGASTDGSARILERWNDHISYWISEPDGGIYDAWNKGVRLARGEWIAFLGADDEYYPHALANYADFIAGQGASNPQYVSSRVELFSNNVCVGTIGKAWEWPRFSKYMTAAQVGAMHKRELFTAYGPYDTSYRICGDYEFLLRPRQTLRAGFFPIVTAKMALGGVSNANPHLALVEQARAKSSTGGRAAWLCRLELRISQLMNFIRKVFR